MQARRAHIAISSMATGSFAINTPGKNVDAQIKELRTQVELAYKHLKGNSQYRKDDTLLFITPEFCFKGENQLFQSYSDKKELLEGFMKISKDYPDLLIMFNLTSLTSKEKTDAEGNKLQHKPKIHKVNAVYALLNGINIFKHYKKNLGVADIPESEKKFFEEERTTYLDKQPKNAIVPGLLQINGITIGVDICVDYNFSNLKKIITNHYHKFTAKDYGVDLHLLMSSSLSNGFWKELNSNEIGLVGKQHCFFVQADGNGTAAVRDQRNGVWVIDQDKKTVMHLDSKRKAVSPTSDLAFYSIEINESPNIINRDIPNHISSTIKKL